MRLLYLSNLRLPTEKAYGIQIAKMCEAFALLKVKSKNEKLKTENSNPEPEKNICVELVVPYRINNIRENFFDYYGVKRNFEFKRIWALDFYWLGKLNKIAVDIKSFISALTLCFYALTHKADVIYSRDEWPLYFLSFFSPAPFWRKRCGMVFEAHRFSPKRKFFYLRFKKKGVKIVTISQAIKNDFINAGYELDKILVAHDGVDLNLFNVGISKEEARKKLNLPLNSKIIMYTGHLFEWKGADTLLQVAKLHSEHSNTFVNLDYVLFVFVGGAEYDIERFKEKARELNNVLILGYKPHKEIPTYLKAADILVLPNSAKDTISSYTSPLKLFEYMASGKPIVASSLPSIREVLNENNAVLVEPDNPKSLAEGIMKVINNNIPGEKLAQKSFDDVQNYTWANRARKILDFV